MDGARCEQDVSKVHAHVLGSDGDRPRCPCFHALEQKVSSKNTNQIKKASDNCGPGKKGPKYADVAVARPCHLR